MRSRFFDVDKNPINGGDYWLGSIKMVPADNGGYAISEGSIADIHNYYGTNVNFKLEAEGESEDVFNTTLYIPEKIDITSVTAASSLDATSGHYKVKRNSGVTVNWTQDPNNNNEVAILVAWTGGYANELGSTAKGSGVRIYEEVADNGSFYLGSQFFQDIPKNALFIIEISRGGSALVTGTDGKTYNPHAFSNGFNYFVMQD